MNHPLVMSAVTSLETDMKKKTADASFVLPTILLSLKQVATHNCAFVPLLSHISQSGLGRKTDPDGQEISTTMSAFSAASHAHAARQDCDIINTRPSTTRMHTHANTHTESQSSVSVAESQLSQQAR